MPLQGHDDGYWSVRSEQATIRDLAWSYAFPTRELRPIAGMIAFYDEQVDTFVNGELQPRPATHFFKE